MQVSVEKVSNTERRLTITVPQEAIDAAYSKNINNYAKTSTIKGFRPGKAPLSFIKERFGAAVRNDSIGEILQDTLQKALIEHNLNPIQMPKITPKKNQPEQGLEFDVVVEILPEVEKMTFTLDTIEKLVVDITPEDVDLVLSQLRKQFTEWKQVARAAQEGDRVVIDFHPILDGEPALKHALQDHPVELGGKQMMPGFEAGLIGIMANESRTLGLHYPDEYPDKTKVGQPISFYIEVKSVHEALVPEFDEDFVKRLGIESGLIADLRQQVETTLKQERDRLINENVKEKIFKHLLAENVLDIPQSLIAQEAKAIHDQVHGTHEHHHHPDDELANFDDAAKKRITLTLLFAYFAKQEKIELDQAKVLARTLEIASVYERPAEVIEWLSTSERVKGLEEQVLEDQIVDKLLEKISITEKHMTYAELKGRKHEA